MAKLEVNDTIYLQQVRLAAGHLTTVERRRRAAGRRRVLGVLVGHQRRLGRLRRHQLLFLQNERKKSNKTRFSSSPSVVP